MKVLVVALLFATSVSAATNIGGLGQQPASQAITTTSSGNTNPPYFNINPPYYQSVPQTGGQFPPNQFSKAYYPGYTPRPNLGLATFVPPFPVNYGSGVDNEKQLRQREKYLDSINMHEKTAFRNLTAKFGAMGNQDSLAQVLFIHSNGVNSPDFFPQTDPLRNEPFWDLFGAGSITRRGIEEVGYLGVQIRAKYRSFLTQQVTRNQIIFNSADAYAPKQSAYSFLRNFFDIFKFQTGVFDTLAGLYNLERREDPFSYLYVLQSTFDPSEQYDPWLGNFPNCKKLTQLYQWVQNSPQFAQKFNKYQDISILLNQANGYPIITSNNFLQWINASQLIQTEITFFPDKVNPVLVEIAPIAAEAANLALFFYVQGCQEITRLHAGVLAFDMLYQLENYEQLVRQGVAPDDTRLKKFVYYSGHITTIPLVLAYLGVFDNYPFAPDPGANIAIESHVDQKHFYLKIYYMPVVPGDYIDITEDVCGYDQCSLIRFRRVIEPYVIRSFAGFEKECGMSLHDINPYYPYDPTY